MLQKLSARFDQLADEMKAIDASERTERSRHGTSVRVDDDLLLAWKVKVKNLIVSACGITSQHYQEFLEAEKFGSFESNLSPYKRMKSVFSAAMDDYKGGYLTSIKNLIQADVFDTELEQASELLRSGYKTAAAVIAGVVLETALRELCTEKAIKHSKLDQMNADLTKTGVYNKLQQKRITALADIRNSAAHGKQDQFSDADVSNMIRDIEQLLATHLA